MNILSLLIQPFNVLMLGCYNLAIYVQFVSQIETNLLGNITYITQQIFFSVYLIRPIGAIFFGYIADKYSQKLASMLTTLCMISGMLIFSLLSASFFPITMFTIAQCLICLSVSGGEGTTFIEIYYEFTQYRNTALSIVSISFFYGLILGNGVSAIIKSFLSSDSLLIYGWRIGFGIGVILCIMLAFIQFFTTINYDNKSQTYTTAITVNSISQLKNWSLSIFYIALPVLCMESIMYHILFTIMDIHMPVSTYIRILQNVCTVILTPLLGFFLDKLSQKSSKTRLLQVINIAMYSCSIFTLITGVLPTVVLLVFIPIVLSIMYSITLIYLLPIILQYNNSAQLIGLLYNTNSLITSIICMKVSPSCFNLIFVGIGISGILSILYKQSIEAKNTININI